MDMLEVIADRIVTRQGKPVHLRGVCVGGWMNMEGFINGFPGVSCSLQTIMAEVLGPSRAHFFFERWLDHFLSEEDIAFIRSSGANLVRLPLNYRHFEKDAQPFHYLDSGFQRLERVVDWCRRQGLYVILDLHAVPGWQNPDWHCDNPTATALFWQQPHFQDRFVALWEEIACRFAGDPVIAGYDLMNEPLSNADSERLGGAYRPDWDTFNRVYRRAVSAIRAIDPDHIIFLEGDGFASRFAGLEAPFAGNLVYSSHNYNRPGWGPGPYPGMHKEGYWDHERMVQDFLEHEGTQFAHQNNVPLWIGEFGPVFNGPAGDRSDRLRGLDDQIDVFNRYNAHWTAWTYKDMGVMGWVYVDPQSEYVQRIAPVLQAKLQLHSDSWMYWLPSMPARDLLGELACLVHQSVPFPGRDLRGIHGQLVKLALGGYSANQLQVAYAHCFKDLSENEIDRVLESFRLEACLRNQELMAIIKKHLLYQPGAIDVQTPCLYPHRPVIGEYLQSFE